MFPRRHSLIFFALVCGVFSSDLTATSNQQSTESQISEQATSHGHIHTPRSIGGFRDLPITANHAVHPSRYASHSISSVPGFFIIQPRIQGAYQSQYDLNFDHKNMVTIDPSVYLRDANISHSSPETGSEGDAMLKLGWESLKQRVKKLNKDSPAGTNYKVVFLARHGQGQHNAAEAFYGMEPWECYWAMAGKNSTHQWGPDAKLTPYGVDEAEIRGEAWKRQISLGAPIPQKHFVSPLSRSIKTMEMTWKDIYGWLGGTVHSDAQKGVKPVVKELFRETLSLHYSDFRSPLHTIHESFPYLVFSPQPFPQFSIHQSAFPEEDPLWDYQRESMYLRDLRIKTALQDALTEVDDDDIFIGITSHFGTIESALRVLGHKAVDVGTTGVIPVVVKIVDNGRGKQTGWYGTYRDVEKMEIEEKSACEGWPEVKIQGGYEVPGGMGTDLM